MLVRQFHRGGTSSIVRHADGCITVLGGGVPLPATRRQAEILQVAGIAVLGVSSLGLASWMTLGTGLTNALEVGAVLAVGTAVVLPILRRVRRERVEIDWRREELRWHARKALITISFDAVRSVVVEGRWPPDTDATMVYDVLIEANPDRLLAGVFTAEERASAWAGELRELIGLDAA